MYIITPLISGGGRGEAEEKDAYKLIETRFFLSDATSRSRDIAESLSQRRDEIILNSSSFCGGETSS